MAPAREEVPSALTSSRVPTVRRFRKAEPANVCHLVRVRCNVGRVLRGVSALGGLGERCPARRVQSRAWCSSMAAPWPSTDLCSRAEQAGSTTGVGMTGGDDDFRRPAGLAGVSRRHRRRVGADQLSQRIRRCGRILNIPYATMESPSGGAWDATWNRHRNTAASGPCGLLRGVAKSSPAHNRSSVRKRDVR